MGVRWRVEEGGNGYPALRRRLRSGLYGATYSHAHKGHCDTTFSRDLLQWWRFLTPSLCEDFPYLVSLAGAEKVTYTKWVGGKSCEARVDGNIFLICVCVSKYLRAEEQKITLTLCRRKTQAVACATACDKATSY